MPPPRNRRASARQKPIAQDAQPAEAPSDPPVEVEVDVPAADAAADPSAAAPADAAPSSEVAEPGEPLEPAATSARRGAQRSSRRSAQRSAKQPQRSDRRAKVLTPEERAARRKMIMIGLIVAGGLAALALIMTAVLWALRTDPRIIAAQDFLNRLDKADIPGIEQALTGNHADLARERYDQVLKQLNAMDDLGGGREPINPEAVISLPLAQRAVELRKRIEGMDGRISAVKERGLVAANLRNRLDRFGRLRDLDDAALDALEKDFQTFIENPVDPGGARSDEAAQAHASAVGEARNALTRVAQEREGRVKQRTRDRERIAQGEVTVLVQAEKYQEALDLIDRQAKEWQQADFSKLRAYVTSAHEKAWTSVSSFIETKRADARAPGATAADRAAARAAARARLEQVIATWGVPETVAKAREQLAAFAD